MTVPAIVLEIHTQLQTVNAKAIIVGGFVRDSVMKSPHSKDIDIEVYGLNDIDALKNLLQPLASVHEVGRSFGVLKMSRDGYDLDISLPRLESKTGRGHKGFSVVIDSSISFEQASSRRDFTMNAIGYDLELRSYLDPHGGRTDIDNHLIKMVNSESFIEDPLRILRAVQFSARLDFSIESETMLICQKMVDDKMLEELPKERIYEELKKLLLRSKTPSIGFDVMNEMGALFPELASLEKRDYHQTMMAVDFLAVDDIQEKEEKIVLMLAILSHRFGKNDLKKVEDFIKRLSDEINLIKSILPLVEQCGMPLKLYDENAEDSAVLKLSTKVNISRLIKMAKASYFGEKETLSGENTFEAGRWLEDKARSLDVLFQPPKPFLQGRDLIAVGLKPGLDFKEILDKAYEKQLEGTFNNPFEAKSWLNESLSAIKRKR